MNRIVGFPDVWSNLVIYIVIPQYRLWLIFLAVIFSMCCVCPNSVGIVRCLHSKSAIKFQRLCYPYKLPDLWLPNSPDLIQLTTKSGTIWQRVQSTKVQDLMQRLIDAWVEVEDSVILKMSLTIGVSVTAFSHWRILWIFTLRNDLYCVKWDVKP